MKTERSFFNAQECAKISKKFTRYAEQGGWDGYELDGSDKISSEKCEEIASQFDFSDFEEEIKDALYNYLYH